MPHHARRIAELRGGELLVQKAYRDGIHQRKDRAKKKAGKVSGIRFRPCPLLDE
jgi:hypothetical protein